MALRQRTKKQIALILSKEGVAFSRQGNYQAALAKFDKAIAIDPTAQLYSDKANMLCQLGYLNEALTAVNEALRLDPNLQHARDAKATVLNEQGFTLAKLGHHQAALAKFDEAIAITPTAQRYSNKADMLFQLGHLDEALTAVNEALRLDPNLQHAKVIKANVLNKQGNRFSEQSNHLAALEKFNEAIALDPTAKLYSNKADMLYKLKRHDEALAAVNEALRLDPNLQHAKIVKVNVLQEQGIALFGQDNNKALEKFNEAIALIPYAGLYSDKANTLALSGRFDEALGVVDVALELDPNDQHAKIIKAYVLNQQGYSLNRQSNYLDALKKFNESIANNPIAIHYSNKADMLYKLKRYDEAQAAVNEALRLDPNLQHAQNIKAHVLHELGLPAHVEPIKAVAAIGETSADVKDHVSDHH